MKKITAGQAANKIEGFLFDTPEKDRKPIIDCSIEILNLNRKYGAQTLSSAMLMVFELANKDA